MAGSCAALAAEADRLVLGLPGIVPLLDTAVELAVVVLQRTGPEVRTVKGDLLASDLHHSARYYRELLDCRSEHKRKFADQSHLSVLIRTMQHSADPDDVRLGCTSPA